MGSSRRRRKSEPVWGLPDLAAVRGYPALVVDQGLLWIALHWAAAALHQAERTCASLEPYFEARNERFGKGVMRVTPEMQRPTAIFWANVQYLMIAVTHLDKALSMLPARISIFDHR